MKTLKVKSILFSFLAIMAVAVFMTSCEQTEVLSTEIDEESLLANDNIEDRGIKKVKVLTWNLQLLNIPDIFFWEDSPCENDGTCVARVNQIVNYIPSSYDILTFSEVFETAPRNALRSGLVAKGYTYSHFDLPSGLGIMSKTPLYGIAHQDFNDCNGVVNNDFDCNKDKGFIHARTYVNGYGTQIIATHLDAGSSSGDVNARLSQLQQIKQFMNTRSTYRPLLITGDLNIRYHLKPNNTEYDRMMCQVLQANSTFELANVNGGRTAALGENPEKLLDYILISKEHYQPISANYRVLTDIGTLSDHRPVESILRFNTSYSPSPEYNCEFPAPPSNPCEGVTCPPRSYCVSGNCVYW